MTKGPGFDLVLVGATIVDGTGAPRRAGSVAIRDGAIARVTDGGAPPGRTVLDVRGLILAPGFIDPHSHSDLPLIIDPKAQSKIRQGVTTEIVGNCGFSPAPVTELNRKVLVEENRFLAGGADFDWSWTTMGGYMARLESQGVAVNVIPLVGHGAVRSAAMGYAKRYPTRAELQAMRDLVGQAMAEGALGLSTGLIYPPGSYADTEEIVELVEVVAASGGYYFSHIRGEGATLLRAVAEAIEIGERTGAPVQIAHHKATGRPYWGRVRDSLDMIERARARGVDVNVDVYPYTASSSGLTQVVPEWALDGGPEALLERLRDDATRTSIEAQISEAPREWDRLFISWAASGSDIVGKPVAQIAAERGITPVHAVTQILLDERCQVSQVQFAMDEADVRYVLKHAASMIGSDGNAISPEPPLGAGVPHPRYYGTFPRVLGRYARDEGLFTLEEAVHKMTGTTARKMGLETKGRIAEGCDADLVVFDERTVIDRATFERPHQFPEGIVHVLVNGRFAVRDGVQTGELQGRVIRRESRGGVKM